jgi:hypothetical protein
LVKPSVNLPPSTRWIAPCTVAAPELGDARPIERAEQQSCH